MDSDLIKTILGSSAVIGLITAVIAGIVKLYNNHIQGRREDDRTESEWAGEFRAAAEVHLPWDQEMRSHVVMLQNLVNQLQAQLKLPVTRFDRIPPAPPLFPRRGAQLGSRFTQTDDKES